MSEKLCSHCHEPKPLTEFNKNRSERDGLQHQCRACQHESGLRWYRNNPDKAKAHYETNRDTIIERATTWNRANAGRRREICRFSYERNPDKAQTYRDAHRAEHKAYYRIWRQANSHIRREHEARREAQKLATQVERVDYSAILERDGYVCHICGAEVRPDELQFDHVIPLARGGPHIATNIKVSHGICNNKKKAKLTISLGG